MTYKLTWEDKGVYCKITGITSIKEIKQEFLSICEDERFNEIHYYILDCSEVESVSFNDAKDADNITGAFLLFNSYNLLSKFALIGTTPNLVKGFELFIKTVNEVDSGWDIRIFDTEKEARNWIDQ